MSQTPESSQARATPPAEDLRSWPFGRDRRRPFAPAPELAARRAEHPASRVRFWDERPRWLITRYEDVRKLFADSRISADVRHPGYPHGSRASMVRSTANPTFLTMDDPEHGVVRRMLAADFTVRRIETMRPGVQRLVDGLVDGLLAGPRPVDLVSALALPVPSLIICQLLGVPYTDHEFFQAQARVLLAGTSTLDDAHKAIQSLAAYLKQLIETKLVSPGDDLLSRLAAEQVATGRLSSDGLADLGVLLLLAGHETTANMISMSTLVLLTNPDQMQELRDSDDPRLLANAVEELLRYLSVVHNGRGRVAVEEIEVAGRTIGAGDGVILPLEAANWDGAKFPDPDRFDIHRNTRGHLAFGFGVHQCLGQPLARLELEIVLGALLTRIPTLRLAVAFDDIGFRTDGLVHGPHELPVTW